MNSDDTQINGDALKNYETSLTALLALFKKYKKTALLMAILFSLKFFIDNKPMLDTIEYFLVWIPIYTFYYDFNLQSEERISPMKEQVYNHIPTKIESNTKTLVEQINVLDQAIQKLISMVDPEGFKKYFKDKKK